VRQLLQRSANVDAQEKDGWTLLRHCAELAEVTCLLLVRTNCVSLGILQMENISGGPAVVGGANADAKDSERRTPLHLQKPCQMTNNTYRLA